MRYLVKFTLLVMLLSLPKAVFGIGTVNGFCETGNKTVAVGGLTSTTKIQQSYSSCTITVYISGTATLATIYSDNAASPTPLGNPFTAQTSGAWAFFASNGTYDVVKSGGTPAISPAITVTGLIAFDPSVATGLIRDCTSPKYTGSNESAKLISCIADLPVTGGMADGRGFEGNSQVWTTCPISGVSKNVNILLGASTVAVSGATCSSVSGNITITLSNTTLSFTGAFIVNGTGNLTLNGNGTLQSSTVSWPYPVTSLIDINTTGNVLISGLTLDQSWLIASHAIPAGFNANNAPSTWGGSWFVRIQNAASVRIKDNLLNNIMRMVYVLNSSHIDISHNIQPTANNQSQNVYSIEGSTDVQEADNKSYGVTYETSATNFSQMGWMGWNSYPVRHTGSYWKGWQVVDVCSTAGTCYGVNHTGSVYDVPLADIGTVGYNNVNFTGNTVRHSGDVCIGAENSNYVSISGNTVDGCFSGGIIVSSMPTTSSTSISIGSNTVNNPMQDYTNIPTCCGRFASGVGDYGAAVAIYLQFSAAVSTCSITGNTASMVTAPPISDAGGPVRAVSFGVFVSTTTAGGTFNRCEVSSNVVRDFTGSVPSFVVLGSSYRLTGAFVLTGTPQLGEIFSDPSGNTFVLVNEQAGFVFTRGLFLNSPFVPASTFTGATSAATIAYAAAPAVTWDGTNMSSNIDRITMAAIPAFTDNQAIAGGLTVTTGGGTAFTAHGIGGGYASPTIASYLDAATPGGNALHFRCVNGASTATPTTVCGFTGSGIVIGSGLNFSGVPVTFANLGAPPNGFFYYCPDCTLASPRAGGGTGAWAKRLGGAWVCN